MGLRKIIKTWTKIAKLQVISSCSFLSKSPDETSLPSITCLQLLWSCHYFLWLYSAFKNFWKTLHYNTSEIWNNILIISLFDTHEGTTQEGKVDEWYGESGLDRKGKSQRYDVDMVLNSKVGITITGFTTKLQLQAKKLARISENGSSDKGKLKCVYYSSYLSFLCLCIEEYIRLGKTIFNCGLW